VSNKLMTIFMTRMPDGVPYVAVRARLKQDSRLFGKKTCVEEAREFKLNELPTELQQELIAVWRKVEEAIG
jgi:hypothetical protein